MFSPQNYVEESSATLGFHYNFSPGTAYTFGSSKSSPDEHSVYVNSSPGAVYIGNSSPDNPAHKAGSCPVIGSNNGSPQISEDNGSVNCSYKFEDFQNTSDLQTYIDNFGADAGFHDTMSEYCSRPDKGSSDDCKLWSSQYPDKSRYNFSDNSNSSSNSSPSVNSKKIRRMYHSDDSKKYKHHPYKNSSKKVGDPDNEGNSFWVMLVIIILIVLVIWIVYDYRRRYHGGHHLGGMGIGGMGGMGVRK